MDENSRVHPGCVNAANPYHECGVNCLERAARGEKRRDKKKIGNHSGVLGKKKDDERRVRQSCPKASNPYHQCDEFCSQRTTLADALAVTNDSDNHYRIKQGDLGKKKDAEKTVYPICAKASNPYHECDDFCIKRNTVANAPGVKKESDIRNGIKHNELSKNKDAGKMVYPNCARAANPYHECDENCLKRNTVSNTRGFKKESGSKILEDSQNFGRKKKGSDSDPISPRVLDNTPADPKSPRSHFSMKVVELENSGSFSSSEQHSEGIYSRVQSFDMEQVQFSQSVPASGNITPVRVTQTRVKEAEKFQTSSQFSSDQNVEVGRGNSKSSTFSFSGTAQTPEESDEEEVESVISDSCVSVGKYHVRSSVSSTLQAILEKYGDVAANCQLESASMRAYYLECLCSVVQELHSTSVQQLTKAKVKEMFLVLKDIESVNIDVSWLRGILNEILEAIELMIQHHAIESTKSKQKRSLETTKKELESRLEDLAQKEKEAADARVQVAETEAKLRMLEHECSHLDKTVSSIKSIVEKFQGKSLVDELL
ncbi:hypothetical protein SLEP1_g30967 [Rubroshorea leprosula]|uniref:Phospholipase-like protein n=1 Tax=Rubroshorea leprosula TaxID=152421 RepID=A0AAV5K4C6_9ROSI|nr:hypothetical protein SLEP1_g30967 [Rubroshorea leprosula]